MYAGYDDTAPQYSLEIAERRYQFGLRSLKLFRFLVKLRDPAALVIGRQLLRSATSIGANVQEAQAAESRADFVHKMAISQKEARETIYRLRMLADSGITNSEKLGPLSTEANEILLILSKIIINTKKHTRP